jgi:arginase
MLENRRFPARPALPITFSEFRCAPARWSPGIENDAQAYRDVQLLSRLQAAGCNAVDDGDVAIPNYLPHHLVPPIRSWPAPRIAWDCISDHGASCPQQTGQIPFLIGCDCSVVIGTTQALMRTSSQDIYVLYIDGDFDDVTPVANHCTVRPRALCGS